MKLETIRTNLERTIAGKEAMLAEYTKARALASREEDHALYATVQFLKVNLEELRAILEDVVLAEKTYNHTISNLGWQLNSDRQGGL
jgi:hypothetical protein